MTARRPALASRIAWWRLDARAARMVELCEILQRREQLGPAIRRAIASGKTACVNVKAKGVISPIVLATTSKRDKASIE
jgi:hypothetical protein